MADPLPGAVLDDKLGEMCPDCGWRRGLHRPAAPAMGMPACPRADEPAHG